ncbi:hypothetical protein [Curtobacterium sp. USHLN213]|uniref:hypothetical protein n=1 Tax=Curtobacterium sp. USHLN213 TaxID=3081255 RepID=UPI003019A735
MLFIAQLVLSLVVGVVGLRRPTWAIGAVLVTASLLPFEVVRTSVGTSWQPATTFTLAIVIVECIRDPRGIARIVAQHLVVCVMLGTFLVIAFATSWFTGRAGDLGTLVLQILGPALLFLWIRSRGMDDADFPRRAARLLVLIGSAQAALVLTVWAGAVPQPWLTTLEGLRWWKTDPGRMVGTFDHPLVAALWMSAAVPLSAALRSGWLRLAAPVLLIVGIALTGSRFALLAAIVAVAVMILRARVGVLAKAGATALASIGAVGFLASEASMTVTERFADDGGSSSARLKTVGLAVERWADTMIVGQGFGASEQVTRNALIGTTFENPFLMFSIDFGLFATLLFFGALITLALSGARGDTIGARGARLGSLVVLTSILGFSSLSANAPTGVLVLVLLALVPTPSGHSARVGPSLDGLVRPTRRATVPQ